MKIIRLISILLLAAVAVSVLASCSLFPQLEVENDSKDKLYIEQYIDGNLFTKTEISLDDEEIELKDAARRPGYHFSGWYIDENLEVPFVWAHVKNSLESGTTGSIKVYGKYIPTSNSADCDHLYMLGQCRLCYAKCTHEWDCAVCNLCDMPCDHKGYEKADACEICGKEMTGEGLSLTLEFTSELCDGGDPVTALKFDTPMYLDEIVAHNMTFWAYILRHGIFDFTINGEPVKNTKVLLSGNVSIYVSLKSDAIEIHGIFNPLDGEDSTQTFYIPKEGLSIAKLGMMMFPQTGGFEALISKVDIQVDGEKITDAGYIVDRSCTVKLTELKSSGGSNDPGKDEPIEFVGIRLTVATDDRVYEDKLKRGTMLSEAVLTWTGYSLDELLERGQLYRGYTRIYKDYALNYHEDLTYYELGEHEIFISFEGTTDLGKGEYVREHGIVKKGSTYEEIVRKILGMSWDEYEERFYNTRNMTNGHSLVLGVFSDTVLSNHSQIVAIGYYEHEKTELVKITSQVNIPGLKFELEVPYDTLLSEVFAEMGFDLMDVIQNEEIFINTYKLVQDVRVKYETVLYGGYKCNHESWNDRTCTLCGFYCEYVYYEGECPICGSYHPSDFQEEYVNVRLYVFDSNGMMIESYEDIRVLINSDARAVLKAAGFESATIALEVGSLYVNGELYRLDDPIALFGGEKLEFKYHAQCDHVWADGICVSCGKVCGHDWQGDLCAICGIEKPVDPNQPREITVRLCSDICGVYTDYGEKHFKSGTELHDILFSFGVDASFHLARFEVMVNGSVTESSYPIHEDTEIKIFRSPKECIHEYDKGICMWCGYVCGHRWMPGSNICKICGEVVPGVTACQHSEWEMGKCKYCGQMCNGTLEHTFVSGVCTNCGCTYQGDDHMILVQFNGIPYYVKYSITLDAFMDLVNRTPDYYNYTFYQKIGSGDDALVRRIYAETVLGEFGNNTTVEIQKGNSDHLHTWVHSECTVCGKWCKHVFNENGVCDSCKCHSESEDHYITVEIFGVPDPNVPDSRSSVLHVRFAMTFEELRIYLLETGYISANDTYVFYMNGQPVYEKLAIGAYGNPVNIIAEKA